ncbi:MAG TPA: cytochrome C oxidase subunit IV family protein [Actinomycetota bacterium]|nr:cytochrome C oxidase subunit IV family protein [Actinomycetota bacterium]
MTEAEAHVEDRTHVETHEASHPSVGEYIKIAIILAIVTGLEVGIAYIPGIPFGWLVASLIVLMVIKFAMVAMWFMHLKFDSAIYRRFFVIGLVLAVVLFLIVLVSFGKFLR